MNISSLSSSVSPYPVQTAQATSAAAGASPVQGAPSITDSDGDHDNSVQGSPVPASPAGNSSSSFLAALMNLKPGG
jgi:hypothetical protein